MLKFHAKKGHLCPIPGTSEPGMVPSYFGRVVTVQNGETTFPATDDPTAVAEGSDFARRAKKLVQREELLPADAATAAACGVPFVQPVREGDGWVVPRGSNNRADAPKRKGE